MQMSRTCYLQQMLEEALVLYRTPSDNLRPAIFFVLWHLGSASVRPTIPQPTSNIDGNHVAQSSYPSSFFGQHSACRTKGSTRFSSLLLQNPPDTEMNIDDV